METIDKVPNVLRNVKEVQSFFGMMQYFDLYIPTMAQYRSKLADLTKKDTVFKFTAEHEEAVRSLKHLLRSKLWSTSCIGTVSSSCSTE